MKAVLLAGGEGTRLGPLTVTTNKHLLCLYDRPVIYHAVEKIVSAGIDKIMLVCSPKYVDHFVRILGSGERFIAQRPNLTGAKKNAQVQIVYGVQNTPNGIAAGLYIAKEYIGDGDCLLYLGDNIIEDHFEEHMKNFKGGCNVFLKKVAKPSSYGIAEVDRSGKVISLEEKPKKPKSNLAVTGLYMYDRTVFIKMLKQKKSARGEYEITDLNKMYLAEGTLKAVRLKKPWFDVGTFDDLLDASIYLRNKKRRAL